jgi:hypothetical protein
MQIQLRRWADFSEIGVKMENYEEKVCSHIPCLCLAEIGSDYCCAACEKAHDATDCECGHPDCRAKA